MARPSVLVVGAALGTLLGIAFFDRFAPRRERLDLYFEDGSMISLEGDSPEVDVVVPYARQALQAAL